MPPSVQHLGSAFQDFWKLERKKIVFSRYVKYSWSTLKKKHKTEQRNIGTGIPMKNNSLTFTTSCSLIWYRFIPKTDYFRKMLYRGKHNSANASHKHQLHQQQGTQARIHTWQKTERNLKLIDNIMKLKNRLQAEKPIDIT